MSWVFSQRSGKISRNDVVLGEGYSGAPHARNHPEMQHLLEVGPIPRGHYRIGPAITTSHGRRVMKLTPVGHNALGRTNFLIHGEKVDGPPGNASRGCIILDLTIRSQIAVSGDLDLLVTE